MPADPERSLNTGPTLVDKVITTLLSPDVQKQFYTVPQVDFKPLGQHLSIGRVHEHIRFSVAPQYPRYEVDQLNLGLQAVDATIRIDHGIERRSFYPADRSSLLGFMEVQGFGMVTYREEGAVVVTTETSSIQPTSYLWKQFGTQIPLYDPETETFDREVSIVMYPNKKLAEKSFEPDQPVYRIAMKELRANQHEYAGSNLLV